MSGTQPPGEGNVSVGHPVKVKLARNPVHEHFNFDSVTKRSQCNACPSKLQGKNPTTLANHLKAKHQSLYKVFLQNKSKAQKESLEEKEKKQAVIKRPDTLDKRGSSGISVKDLIGGQSRKDTTKWSYSDPRQKKVTKKLAVTIATSCLPVNIVSNQAFKEFIAELNTSAQVPAKDKMRKEVNLIWNDVREAIGKALKAARRVSITTDVWTTKGCTTSFLGVTVHFYNSETKCRGSNKIACREFSEKHTAENIAELILKVCEEYSIHNKLTHIASDNGSNMVKAVRVFNKEYRSGSEEQEAVEHMEVDELSDGGDSSDDLDASDEEEMEDLDDSEEAEEVERRVLAEVDEHEERDLQFDDVLKRKNVRRSKCFSHTLQCATVRN